MSAVDIPQAAIRQAEWRSDSLPDDKCRCLRSHEIRVVLEEALPILRQQWAAEMRGKVEALHKLPMSSHPLTRDAKWWAVDLAAVLAVLDDEGSSSDE